MNEVVTLPAQEVGVGKRPEVQRDRGLDAFDDRHLERTPHAGNGLLTIAAMRDDLGDHRVVVGRDVALRVCGGVDPDAGSARRAEDVDEPW